MRFLADKSKQKKIVVIASIVFVIAIMTVVCAVYLSDYYRTDYQSVQEFSSGNQITIHTLEDGTMIFEPNAPTKGLIFYPGGKVEYTAYQPLMEACAEQGIFCVLIEMPCNLSVLDVNAADGIQELYPEIESWYIGGHSLGGAMAASYLANHEDEYEGLVLLGAYSAKDLSDTKLDVLSIYGSEDKVLNREKYEDNKCNLPENFIELVIDGGCHSYFGMYGMQDGDGIPEITNEEQIYITARQIYEMLQERERQ